MSAEFEGVTVEGSFDEKFSSTVHQFASHIAKGLDIGASLALTVNGEIVIRPMMYLALSYDHRIVDGKGAVTFLVRVKEALEDPRRLLMDL